MATRFVFGVQEDKVDENALDAIQQFGNESAEDATAVINRVQENVSSSCVSDSDAHTPILQRSHSMPSLLR